METEGLGEGSENREMRVAFVLPGLHRVNRGAEAAFENIAREVARTEGFAVTVLGSGAEREGEPYAFRGVSSRSRERFEGWPKMPLFRNEYRWEEFFWAWRMGKIYRRADYDLTVTCSFPFVHWRLRWGRKEGVPKHIYVTENGDWAPRREKSEYRFFACDGLICTNPEYQDRHAGTYRSVLIPNGIDARRFRPGAGVRERFAADPGKPLVLMVSALIESKFVPDGIRAVAALGPDVHFVVAGDGPERELCDSLGAELLGERYRRVYLSGAEMPDLYRSADCLLHLSRDEAFGNIYIEAAASGLPVVAHDSGNTRWILGDAGVFADGGDPAGVIEALREALAAPSGDEAKGARHAAMAGRFDWPIVGAAYAAFFREVMYP